MDRSIGPLDRVLLLGGVQLDARGRPRRHQHNTVGAALRIARANKARGRSQSAMWEEDVKRPGRL